MPLNHPNSFSHHNIWKSLPNHHPALTSVSKYWFDWILRLKPSTIATAAFCKPYCDR